MRLVSIAGNLTVQCKDAHGALATTVLLKAGEGAKLPDPSLLGYYLAWHDGSLSRDGGYEEILVTGKSGDELTVVRGQNGTNATGKDVGFKTYLLTYAGVAESDEFVVL